MAGEKTDPSRHYAHPEDWVSGAISITEQSGSGGHDAELIAAQGAGVRTYLTFLSFSNKGSRDVVVTVKDGSTTKLVVIVPTLGGNNLPVMLKGSANTAWNVSPDIEDNTLYANACGFAAKE